MVALEVSGRLGRLGGHGCVDVLENKYIRNVRVVLKTRSDDAKLAAMTMRISRRKVTRKKRTKLRATGGKRNKRREY